MRTCWLACLVACGHPQATAPDGPPGADASADVALDAAPSCGGQMCRDDQSCVAGSCTFDCAGARVPGDYATISGAIGALVHEPGAVICLAAQTYDEDDLTITGDHLTLVGAGADRTTITTAHDVRTLGTATIKGVTFSHEVTVDGVGADTTAIATRFAGGLRIQREQIAPGPAGASATLDGCDIAGGILMFDPGGTEWQGDLALDVRDSYIHDGAERCLGGYLTESSADLTITAIGNTIARCATGIDISVGAHFSATTVATLAFYNNIITGMTTTGIALDVGAARSGSTVDTGHDALWGNAANYAGSAIAGPGYVTADCLLDGANPPGLGAASPCRAAGDPTHTTPTDYWGRPRPSPPDIGAIQMP